MTFTFLHSVINSQSAPYLTEFITSNPFTFFSWFPRQYTLLISFYFNSHEFWAFFCFLFFVFFFLSPSNLPELSVLQNSRNQFLVIISVYSLFWWFHLLSWPIWGLPGDSVVKEYICQCRRCRIPEFDPWIRKIPGGGNDNSLKYSCWENPMDRGACWATVHGAAKSRTQLSDWAEVGMTYMLMTSKFISSAQTSSPNSSLYPTPSSNLL